MQKTFLLPVRFIFFFIISALIMFFFCLLLYWADSVSLESLPGEVFFQNLPAALGSIIFPAVSSALVFSFFSSRHIKISIPAVFITTLIIFIILFFGYSSLSLFKNIKTDKEYKPLNNNMLQATDDYIIYSGEILKQNDSKDILKNVIIKKRDSELPGFKYYNSAEILKTNKPKLVINTEKTIKISPSNPVFGELLSPNNFIKPILENIEFFGEFMTKTANKKSITYFLYTIAATVFLMACMFLKNSSSCPLLEISQIFIIHAGFYFLFNIFAEQSEFIASNFLNGVQHSTIPLFLIFTVSILIFLFGVFNRLNRGKRVT